MNAHIAKPLKVDALGLLTRAINEGGRSKLFTNGGPVAASSSAPGGARMV